MATLNKVYIGRDLPNKENMFKIPDNFKKVSNTHALIYQDESGNLFIKDLDSTNGTFVNNIQILEAKICASDIITLGGKNDEAYRLPLNNLIVTKFKPTDREFDERMNHLKDIYLEYNNKADELESTRYYISFLRGAPLILAFLFRYTSPKANIQSSSSSLFDEPLSIALLILIIVLLIGINIWTTAYHKKSRKAQKKLREEFQIKYKCPNCRTRLETFSWSFIEDAKECPCCKRPFNPKT